MKSCLKCTYENHGRRKKCEMCHSPLVTRADDAAGQLENRSTSKKRGRSSSSSQKEILRSQSLETLPASSSSCNLSQGVEQHSPPLFANGRGEAVTLSSKGHAALKILERDGETAAAKSSHPKQPDSSESPSHLSFSNETCRPVAIDTHVHARTSSPSTDSSHQGAPGGAMPAFVTFSTSGKQKEWKISEKALEAAKAKMGLLDDNDDSATLSHPAAVLKPPTDRHDGNATAESREPQNSCAEPISVQSDTPTMPRDIAASEQRRSKATITRALLGVSDFSTVDSKRPNATRPSFRAPTVVDSAPSPSIARGAPALIKPAGFTTPMNRGSFNTPRLYSDACSSAGNTSSKTVSNRTSLLQTHDVASSSCSKLKPIVLTQAIASLQVRCPIRKALPSMEDLLRGHYQLPVSLCCSELQSLMSLTTSDVFIREEHFVNALVSLGARRDALSGRWMESVIRCILRKLLSFELSEHSQPSVTLFSPFHVLLQLLYRYNREYVDGHRSILRRVAEKDSPSTTLMVLCVSNTSLQERPGPHQSMIEVTDGWYFVRCNLDLPLSQFVRDGLINVGDKILIWGASPCRESACSPLELLTSSSALLNLAFNGTKLASPFAPLGSLPPSTVMPVPITSIHSSGGAVPCISGVVTRILPKFYIERPPPQTLTDATPARGSSAVPKVVRNAIAESKCAGSSESLRETAYERALAQGMGSDAAAVLMRDQFSRDVSEVTTIILETGQPGEVVAIQRTTRCGGASGDMDESSLPKEGQRIHIFGLVPSKASTAPPPLSVKLLFVRSQFMFVVDHAAHNEQQDDNGSKLSFRFNVVVERTLSSLATKVFGQMVDVIVICIGSQTQPGSNSETGFFFCGIEKNIFGVLVARTIRGAREIELAQPTPGTACLVRNATFACFDESGAYNIVRLHANEYTMVTTRTMSLDLQQKMKAMENDRGTWKPTFDIGKQLLADPLQPQFARDALGRHSVPSVHEVVAYAGGDEWNDSAHHASVSGPYYLRSGQRSTTPMNGSTGVKLSATPGTSSTSIMRPLFDDVNPQSSGGKQGGEHTARQSCDIPAIVDPPPHRHVFGNISVSTLAICFDDGALVNMHTDIACALSPQRQAPATYHSHHCSGFEISLQSHIGSIAVQLTPLLMAALGEHISLTPQQLSALASDDDAAVHFSVSRSLLLDSAADLVAVEASWERLLCHSVVVPPNILSIIVQSGTSPPNDSTIDESSCDSAFIAELHRREKDDSLQRWNRALVPDINQVLWWTVEEWRLLISELQEALSLKLFKLTLAEDGKVVRRLFFLKDNCAIADLMEV